MCILNKKKFNDDSKTKINQLPELAIPRNRTFAPANSMTVTTTEKRNPYITKWYVLFDNKNDQWISFQPQIGRIVYPCFACRDMFGSRNSFMDHVNRRGLVLKYSCMICKKLKKFYSTCSFLLHCREHFTDTGGQIDLDSVDISTIPMEIAGFLPIPNVPRLYDTEDDTVNINLKLSVKFYKPSDDCVGKRFINFVPNDLVFFCSLNNNNNTVMKDNQAMILKQVNIFIPKCIFVSVVSTSNNTVNENKTSENILNHISDNDSSEIDNIESDDSDIICLDDEDSHLTNDDVNINTKISVAPKLQVKCFNSVTSNTNSATLNPVCEPKLLPNCPECKEKQRIMLDHFQEITRPVIDLYKCKTCGLISTSACALKAHIRIHDKSPPYVCPECGNDFETWDELDEHMENVCFHTAKTVRFKCPAKKCGKVFAQNVTFSSHFPVAHMKVRFACVSCSKYFINEIEFSQHTGHVNDADKSYVRVHECTVCSSPANNIKEHVLNHVQDKENRIFVFTCRYCRSYYRSKQTYATHIAKCTKLLLNSQVKKEVQRSELHKDMKCKVNKFCATCNCKIQFNCFYKDIISVTNRCPHCSTPFSNNINKYEIEFICTANSFVRKDFENNLICILCSKKLENGFGKIINFEQHKCKYKNPKVVLKPINDNPLNLNIVDNLDLLEIRQVSPNSDDSSKRKRKRLLNGTLKNKKNCSDKIPEESLSADPEPFDGEYKCKFCNFKNESRKAFHHHIQRHRDISTSYQCMECGECFVVKPSLEKHLQVFHVIENIASYMKENECFDREAVRMLEKNMRMIPGEVNEPVADNQCKICRQIFPDDHELSKHFRVHGMAFLMKKIIK